MGRYLSSIMPSEEDFNEVESAAQDIIQLMKSDKRFNPLVFMRIMAEMLHYHVIDQDEDGLACFLMMMNLFEVNPLFKKVKNETDALKVEMIKGFQNEKPVEN